MGRPLRGRWLAGLLGVAAAGCSPGAEYVILLDLSADEELARGSEVTVRAQLTREQIWANAPVASLDRDLPPGASFRIAVQLAGPDEVMVHLEARSDEVLHEATRCFSVVGVLRATVAMTRLDESLDGDGDGWPSIEPCAAEPCDFLCPPGAAEDCDSESAEHHPGGIDRCADGEDQDCDGADDPCEDGDGDGAPACPEGVAVGCDCGDDDPDVHPGALESPDSALCENDVDDDCDGADARCDRDGDGVPGCADALAIGCDCDDTEATVHPGATETPDGECNGRDDNCNQVVDEDPACLGPDLDRDGSPASCADAVDPPPDCRDDCNDCSAAMSPGGLERCGDGLDGACLLGGLDDGLPVADGCDADDRDEDGFIGEDAGGPDCDDDDSSRRPGAPDRCGDGVDADCSGQDSSCADDADGDGYSAAEDCDDDDAAVAPELPDGCDGVDTDCDGVIDEDVAARHGCVAGREVDFQTDLLHCGDCRAGCNAGCGGALCRADLCDAGRCLCGDGEPCTGGSDDFCCPGTGCHDLGSDPENCGACGLSCPGVECRSAVCNEGTCGEAQAFDGTACSGGRFCCDGACSGSCAPEDQEVRGCGRCGLQSRSCDGECQWQDWGGCAGEGPCTPGQTQELACGGCGTQTRVCAADCQWGPWSTCEGEGACAPGVPNRQQPCGECGSQEQSCSALCTWQDVGHCDGTPARSCDDGDGCTVDSCDADGSCAHDPCEDRGLTCCGGACSECCGTDTSGCGAEPRCADWSCSVGQCTALYEEACTDPENECNGNRRCNGRGGCAGC